MHGYQWYSKMSLILWCVLSLSVGILAAKVMEVSFLAAVAVAAILLVACVGLIRRNSKWAFCLLAVACAFVGLARGEQKEHLAANDISAYIGKTISAYAVVEENPEVLKLDDHQQLVRYRLGVQAVKTEIGAEKVSGGVFANVRQEVGKPVYSVGDNLLVTGTLNRLHSYNNPGLSDKVASWRRQGYTARLSVSGEPFYTGQTEHDWRSTVHSIRSAIVAKMNAAMPPSDVAILKGTLFGGYSGISPGAIREFSATGIIHILSVSGSHIALVAGAIHWVSGIAGLRRRSAAMLACAGIVFYALLAGLSPPVTRSVAMGLIALLAAVWGRERDAVTALAVTAGGMLLFDPTLIDDISFQLSFSGTAGLVLFYTKTAEKLSVYLPAWLSRPLAATAAAQLGILPVLSWYFNSIPLMSFAANLLVVPAIELTIILGLLGGLSGVVIPGLGHLLLVSCSLILSAARHINSVLALLPLSIYLPPMNPLFSLVYYGLILWIYGYFTFLPDVKFLLRRRRRQILVFTAVLSIAAVVAVVWPRPLSIHFIDVGQGDATLVLTPRGRAVLIDAGGTTGDFDIGERVVLPYLRRMHVTELEYLLLTHAHQDHAGGAAAIAATIPVTQVLLPQEERTPAVENLYRLTGVTIIPAHNGQSFTVDGVRFALRSPSTPSINRRSGNETSCAVEIRYGEHSFLITGDLEGSSEQNLLNQGLAAQTVLKVGHHGAKSSSSVEFLKTINPQYAVISVGANNRYGHPHPDTLERLQNESRIVFRTDKHGAIVFESDGLRLTARPYLKK